MRSSEATAKRHIFITGAKGRGKTALFEQLRQRLGAACITTFAVKGEGVYLKEGAAITQVGVYDGSLPGEENKMRPIPAGFAAGAEALRRLGQRENLWVGIDEVGYLETEDYRAALLALLEQKRVLAAVRKQDLPFLTALLARQDALVVDLDGNHVGCVIMASGMGERFGGNKLMADLGGKPMVQWALEAAEGVFCKTVAVTRHEAVADLCESRGIPTVLHNLPHRSDTVRLGLEAVGPCCACVFLPADQPFVTRQSLWALALAAENSRRILRLGGKAPVSFPQWAFEELKTLPQGKGGSALIAAYGADSLAAQAKETADIDTQQALAEAQVAIFFDV